MRPRSALLLSLHPRHAESILRGDKLVELRRRPPRCPMPADVLIYATAPIRALVGRCRFGSLVSASPDNLWASFGRSACVSRDEFDAYFAGRTVAHALTIIDFASMPPSGLPVPAPQSFAYLRSHLASHHGLLALLEQPRTV